MYNEASQELGSFSIPSTCQEAFAFGFSQRLAFYPFISHTHTQSHPEKARGQPAKELVFFPPRTFQESPLIPLSFIIFNTQLVARS